MQPGVPEDELGGPQEVHQWSHQQGQRLQHRQHHPGAAAGEHREGQVTNQSPLKSGIKLFIVVIIRLGGNSGVYHNQQ